MALSSTIQFKRGAKATLEARLVADDLGIPLKGEPVYETDTNKIKIGDGVSAYKDLPYLEGSSTTGIIVKGYYNATYDTFFQEAAYINPIPAYTTRFYIDITTSKIYYYLDSKYNVLPNTGTITLYTTTGQNTDGAMTQKATTDELNKKIEMTLNSTDEYIEITKGLTA